MAQPTRTPIERHPVEKSQDALASGLAGIVTILLASGIAERYGIDQQFFDAVVVGVIAIVAAARHIIERRRDTDIQFVLDELAKAGPAGQEILDKLNDRRKGKKSGASAALLLFFAPLMLTGCLSKVLKVPAEDHAVQSNVILQRCELAEIDPCPVPLEDLRAMARQAELIDDIVKGDKPEPAPEPEPEGETEGDGG